LRKVGPDHSPNCAWRRKIDKKFRRHIFILASAGRRRWPEALPDELALVWRCANIAPGTLEDEGHG
jgi:hypothetical protein